MVDWLGMLNSKNQRLFLILNLIGSIALHGFIFLALDKISFSGGQPAAPLSSKFIEVSLEPKGKYKKSLSEVDRVVSKDNKFSPSAFKPSTKLTNIFLGSSQQKISNKEVEINPTKVIAGNLLNKPLSPTKSLNHQNTGYTFSETLSIPGRSQAVGVQAIDVDPILNYTFMFRFTRSVFPRWVEHLQFALNGVAQEELLFYPYKQTLTIFEIQMDKEGYLTKLILLQSCGIDSIDESAAKALYATRKFSNPPQYLRVSDNLYRLKVAFNVILAN